MYPPLWFFPNWFRTLSVLPFECRPTALQQGGSGRPWLSSDVPVGGAHGRSVTGPTSTSRLYSTVELDSSFQTAGCALLALSACFMEATPTTFEPFRSASF